MATAASGSLTGGIGCQPRASSSGMLRFPQDPANLEPNPQRTFRVVTDDGTDSAPLSPGLFAAPTNQLSGPSAGSRDPSAIQPVGGPVADVVQVQSHLQFVVLDFGVHPIPVPGTYLILTRSGQAVAVVRTGRITRASAAVADLVAGEARSGDQARSAGPDEVAPLLERISQEPSPSDEERPLPAFPQSGVERILTPCEASSEIGFELPVAPVVAMLHR